jgi:hypothetical protein
VRERLLGRPLAYVGGAHPTAGWFGDDRLVVVVARQGSAAGLAAARAVLYSYVLNQQVS